jgi:hypothetical protein
MRVDTPWSGRGDSLNPVGPVVIAWRREPPLVNEDGTPNIEVR